MSALRIQFSTIVFTFSSRSQQYLKCSVFKNDKLLSDCCVFFRIESYSCKMIGVDKQKYKKFNSETDLPPNSVEALSPPTTGFGCYDVAGSRQRTYSRYSNHHNYLASIK